MSITREQVWQLDACAKNCWERWYVVDVDIEGFFNNIDHTKMMDILRRYTKQKHILMYCERCLKAPVQKVDGSQIMLLNRITYQTCNKNKWHLTDSAQLNSLLQQKLN